MPAYTSVQRANKEPKTVSNILCRVVGRTKITRVLLLTVLMTAATGVQAAVCDVDDDGDIDSNDINLVLAGRGTDALPGDPRDPDGDGVISVLDVRQCIVLCTLARCAVPQPNSSPDIVSAPVTIATEGEVYSYDVGAFDPDADTLSFSLDLAPAGMAINPSSGLITWTPTAAQLGANAVTVRVTDPGALFATQSFSINVSEANLAPTITSVPITVATEGEVYGYDVEAIDPNAGDPLSFSLDLAPAGMAINPSSGLITWTPTAAQLGANAVTVRVTDPGALFATQSFVIDAVAANRAPTIVSSPPATGLVGETYLYSVGATDPDGDTLTFSLDLAPAGMTIDVTSGLIEWIPAVGQVGANPVTLRVQDAGGLAATQSYTITVGADNDTLRPEVTLSVSANVVLAGDVVTVTALATDDVAVTSLSVTADGAPITLDLSGNGTFTNPVPAIVLIEATATDPAGNTGVTSLEVRFLAGTGGAAPSVLLTTPAENAVIDTIIDVIGTADDADLVRYELELADSNTNQFFTIGTGATPVSNDVLGQIDATMLRNGIYDLRLTAEDANGNVASTARRIELEGENSVGNFTLAFEDLVIPVSGLDISITRVYDSRIKTRGEFGIGTRLVLNDIRVQENGVLGEGWQQNQSGGFFTTYTVVPTRAHTVRITQPNGESERFDYRVTSGASTLFPYSLTNQVTTGFFAEPGSGAALVALGHSNQRPVLGGNTGPVTLIDDFSNFDNFDPDRYLYTSEDGTEVIINQFSGIERITDPNGNSMTFGPGGLIHSAGKSVLFARDSLGRITTITDPNGNVITYEYDFYGDLVATTDQVGNTSRMTYNSNHGLVNLYDPNGDRPARNEYDANGRLAAIIDAEGNRMEFTHDIAGRTEIVRDRNGNPTVYEYDDRGNIVREINPGGFEETRTFDADGNVLQQTDALGNVTTFTYDALGNPLSKSDALGNVTTTTFNARNQPLTETDANGNVTTRVYDARGNETSQTDALGNATANTYDGQGNRLTTTTAAGQSLAYSYDAAGNATTYVDFAGNTTSYTYDANGNRLTESMDWTDASGTPVVVTTRYTYDALNRLIEEQDPLGNIQRTEYNAIGEISATVDKNGNRTEHAYDARKNLIRKSFADGTEEVFTYDPEKNRTSITGRNGATTTYSYDFANRLTRIVHPDGTEQRNEYDAAGRKVAGIDGRGSRTEFTFDAAGRLIAVTDAPGNTTTHSLDVNGNVFATTDANGNVTQFVYDDLNRVIQTIFADGSTTAKSYDSVGQVVSETDQAGNTTLYGYDALRRLTSVTNALGGVTAYTYDEMGNRTSQSDAQGRVTTWTYDAMGRVLSRALPLGQTETFTYDPAGNLLSQTDFAGQTTSYQYDANHRRIRAEFAGGAVSTYTYNPTGRLLSVTDARGTVTNTYDARDRLIRTTNPDGTFLDYAYDAAGNRIQTGSPGGTTMFSYDTLNRLATATDPDGGTSTHTYDAVGNRATQTHDNGTVTTTSYDGLNRLTNIVSERADTSVIESFAYTLDPVGNRVSATEGSGRVVNYTYDALYRLTSESESARSVSYTYDAVGNRLSRTDGSGVTLSTYDGNDRLVAEGAATYAYDDNGNLTSKTDGPDVSLYEYDSRNRLAASTVSGLLTTYAYDDDGILVRSSEGGVTTGYLVDKNVDDRRVEVSRVIEESTATGPIARYVYGDDLLSQTRGGTTTYYHYDGIGSTRALTDASGLTTDTYSYDAFGELLNVTGSTPNDYLFAGEQIDANTGFYYLRARWYDPAAGRFLGMDTFPGIARDPPTLHKYTYSHNNPINLIDPTGQFAMAATLGAMPARIALPTINYALILARVYATVRTVATAAVATCAASQAISTFTALTGPVAGCNTKGANVFYSGWIDTPLTTAHVSSAMAGGHAGPLNRISPKHSRRWINRDARCAGNVAGLTGLWCDEYPFASVRQGGQANAASLRLVPGIEQAFQGGKLSAFYFLCNIVPNDPVKGLFAVAFAPVTGHQCGP